MKLEKLNTKDKVYKFFLYGLIYVVVLLLIFNFVTSRAKYRVTQSIPLVRGTITSSMYDFHIVGIYLKTSSGDITGKDGTKYKETDEIPGNNYKINETNSYCYIGTEDNIDTEAKLYTNSKGEHIISNLTKKDNCYLYFDGNGAASDTIIADKEIKPETDKMFNVPDSTTTTEVLYQAEDDDGTSYYYRGNPTDNWVYFGGYYWRIIRINGDGTIRMIYQGTTAVSTGTTTQIGTSAFNSGYDDNKYVGYFYEQDNVHGLIESSNIYTTLNEWFAGSNIKQGSSYYQYIDPNAGFCNDRTPSTTNTPTVSNGVNVGNGSGGTGTTATYYGANLRLVPGGSIPSSSTAAVTPSLKCTNSDDLFTYSGANQGNKKLENPVGLITADEVAFGGLVYAVAPSSRTNYLVTGQYYWTMSPSFYRGSGDSRVFRVWSSGSLSEGYTYESYGVRPVINLRSDVELTGEGTTSSPYKIKENLPDIIADKEVLERTSENKDFNVPFTEDTTGKIYKAEDDDGTSYYFAGNPSDNWVYFGGYYWRIIRINGDGTIRMIYQGTKANKTGEGTQIGTSAFNSVGNNNKYVGYGYGDNNPHGLTTASTMYATLNEWFNESKIKKGSEYYQYIDLNAGFCNDREPSTTATPTVSNGVNVGNGSGGTGTTLTYYGAYLRLLPEGSIPTLATGIALTPSLKCTNSDDLFTYSGSNKGNHTLVDPIGLITADEVVLGGLVYSAIPSSRTNYLDTGQVYGTMSPAWFDDRDSSAKMFNVQNLGYFSWGITEYAYGVRPVINLKANVLNSGDGTVSNPYQIAD